MGWLTEWRMRRFLKTLPPVAADAGLIRRSFRRDLGREFNPWRAEDRSIVSNGVTRALIRSLDEMGKMLQHG